MSLSFFKKIFLLLVWLSSVYVLATSPAIIPIHFGADGVANNYGSKYILLLLPAMYTAMYFLFSYYYKHPQHFNYPVAITPANQQQQYAAAKQLLQTLLVCIGILFLIIIGCTYLINLGSITQLPTWLLPIILCIIFLPIGKYF